MAALGALSLPSISYSFDSKGTAIVPVTTGAGDKKIGKIEIQSPMTQMSEFFSGIDKSLINLVDFAKQSLGIEQKAATKKKFADADTGKKKPKTEKDIIGSLEEAFGALGDKIGKTSIGEKLSAALLIGGLLLFNSVQDQLVAIITPVVAIMKGLISFLGVKGTFGLFLGIFVAMKLGIGAIVANYLKAKVFQGLAKAYLALQKFNAVTLVNGIKNSYSKGGFLKGFKLVNFAMKALRLMFTATMYPAILGMVTTLSAAMGPILGPLVVIAAIAAGIGAVLFSIKSGIEAFKNSLESGDGMITAIAKGLLDFSATLITLPITLLKNLLGYIAGLLGFDGIKEAIDNFSFKDMIVNAFTSLIGGTIRIIKAIAKGAGAALAAAFPGGEGPGEAFSRVFKEVMSGGEGKMPEEGPEQGEGINRMETSEVDINLDEKLPENGQSFVDFALKGDKFKEDKKIQGNALATAKSAMSSDSVYKTTNTFNTETNMMKEKVDLLLKIQIEKMKIEKENKSAGAIMVNTTNQGDVYNQKKETNVSGELSTEHSDPTSRMINDAMTA